jgi:hypothetical protein
VVVTGSGEGVGIPEVMLSMGIAPGPPVIVLGGRLVVVVPEVGTEALEMEELRGLLLSEVCEVEVGLGSELEVGFCLSTK